MCFKPVTLLHTLRGILLFLFCTSIAGAQSSSLVWDTSFNPAGVDEPIAKFIPFQNGILFLTNRNWHGEGQYFENQRWGYLNLESKTFEGHPILEDIGIDVNDVLELPDGSIVVAGEFSEIGGLPASNISVFVDNTWHALGNGLNGAIKSLVLYQDNICAGGRFTASGAVQLNSIACWVDNAWQPLGSGIQTAPGDSFTADVYVLASEGNVLYAGGDFSQAGGSLTNGFAAWNGNEWIDETRGLSNTNNRRVRVYDFELGKNGEV